MKIRLGYVARTITLDDITSSHTITYTNYQKLNKQKQSEKLYNLITQNFEHLEKIFKYNLQNDVYFYRMSQSIIPLATHKEVKFDYIKKFKNEWSKIGNIIKENEMRVDMHPDQFCVLNSTNPIVFENSIRILNFNYSIYKAMGINSKAILHVGSSVNGKEESLLRFKNNFSLISKKVRDIIILENDDKVFTVKDTLELCEELNIPMVLDYHHHTCNNYNDKIDLYLERIFNTWKKTNLIPKIHFSSPKSRKEKRSHHEYINYKSFILFLEKLKNYNTDVDIMLECKAKDEALFRLLRQIKFYHNFEFINNTTFIIK